MTIVRYRPMSTLSTLEDVLDDFWDRSYGLGSFIPTFGLNTGFRPGVETFIKGNELHMWAEIPGVDPKDVAISLDDGHLCIKGERKMPEVSEDACLCMDELSYGSFNRCFHVPRDLDASRVHAHYENGMLDISISLGEPVSKQMIPIEGVQGKTISIQGASEERVGDPSTLLDPEKEDELMTLTREAPYNA